jgi:hypothetical protein
LVKRPPPLVSSLGNGAPSEPAHERAARGHQERALSHGAAPWSVLLWWAMAPFLFQCPKTRLNVQGWLAEEIPSDNKIFLTVECVACGRVHLVNPATGKVMGRDDG